MARGLPGRHQIGWLILVEVILIGMEVKLAARLAREEAEGPDYIIAV